MGADASFLALLNAEAALWALRMAHACMSGSPFIIGIWVVCRLMPRLPAALRASLWWLACLKLVLDLCGISPVALPLLPAASALRVGQAALPSVKSPTLLGPTRVGQTASAEFPTTPHEATSRAVFSPPPALHFSGPLCLQVLWLMGVSCCLLRAAHQGLRFKRLVQAAPPAALPTADAASLAVLLGLSHVPPLLESGDVSAPCVAGLFRPVILLPQNFTQILSPDEARLALAHEMAHLRRNDLRLALLPALAQTLFFFHPLVWLGVREWAAAREEACDALALGVTRAEPAHLGSLLLKLAGGGNPAPALGLSPGYRALRRRLVGLSVRPTRSRQARWLVGVALLALIPWRLTAAIPPHSPASSSKDGLAVRYTVSDLGDVTEAAGLNATGQTALTWRDGEETQAVAGDSKALTLLGALPKHHFSIAYGINAQGAVAAASYNIPGHGRAFVWDGSRHRLGSLPGYPYSEARAVNDTGQVAGFAETGGHDRWQARVARAFFWQSGAMTDVGTLGGPYSYAYGLNNQGQVVGKADTDTFGQTHAFLWQNGQMQDLGTLGGANSLACRVSDSGMVVGSTEMGMRGMSDIRHAFVWQNGIMRDLGALPGLPDSLACGVNAQAQIVGYAEPTPDSPNKRAVLWQSGHALDLNALLPAHSGWVLTEARAINDRGQIAGNGTLNGQPRAFLLTPVVTLAPNPIQGLFSTN